MTVFGIFLNPVATHSFTLKALEKLYLARSKQMNLFSTKKKVPKTKKKGVP